MRKLIISTFVILALVLSAEPSFAKKICLQDNFGGFWELKGGKIDTKPYTAKYIVGGNCEIPGYVTATTVSTGIQVSFVHSHSESCVAVMYQIVGDESFNGSGNYDILVDGSVGGSVTMTKVGCNLLQTTPLSAQEGSLKAPALKERE